MVLNREQLKTGSKPAPGELALVQAVINTIDLENGTDDLASPELLRQWLVQFGLLAAKTRVDDRDWKLFMALREGLRGSLLANHGDELPEVVLENLNRLVSQFQLSLVFQRDGRAQLVAINEGVAGAAGQLLAIVAQAVMDGSWSRLKICSSATCKWAFYDSSKNQSGRWCSMSVCGSRLKAREYRRRRAQQTST
jgi:predicted RNA-binding Zn ribbon-like protein